MTATSQVDVRVEPLSAVRFSFIVTVDCNDMQYIAADMAIPFVTKNKQQRA